jgi:hypothetical protein
MTNPRPVSIEISRPSRTAPCGQVEEGFFVVDDGFVRLTDAAGKPLVRSRLANRKATYWEYKLIPDEDIKDGCEAAAAGAMGRDQAIGHELDQYAATWGLSRASALRQAALLGIRS